MDAVEDSRARAAQVADAASGLIGLGSPSSAGIASPAVDTLLAEVLGGYRLRAVDVALNSLIESEGLGVVSNPQLRRRLSEWPRLLGSIRATEVQAESLLLNGFLPYLSERIPMRVIDQIAVPESADLSTAFQADYRPLFSDIVFENHINFALFYALQHQRGLDRLDDMLRETLDLLRRELEGAR